MGFREERNCAICGKAFVAEGVAHRKRTCSESCRVEYSRQEMRRKQTGDGFREERNCVYCGKPFVAEGSKSQQRTCSPACSREEARRRTREWAAKKYQKRENTRPERTCEVCGNTYQPVRDTQRWCSQPCKRIGSEQAKPSRKAPRVCRTCKTVELPPSRSQVQVCDNCRVDPRPGNAARDRRRLLRTYGMVEEDFQQMLSEQEGRCAICGTTEPGSKGWNIDHDHSQRPGIEAVRGLLCRPCNTALGFLQDDPVVLQSAIDYLNKHRDRQGF